METLVCSDILPVAVLLLVIFMDLKIFVSLCQYFHTENFASLNLYTGYMAKQATTTNVKCFTLSGSLDVLRALCTIFTFVCLYVTVFEENV